MNVWKDFGLTVQKTRLALQITQSELAKEIGISRVTMNKLENGVANRGIAFITIARLASILKLPIEFDLFCKNSKYRKG